MKSTNIQVKDTFEQDYKKRTGADVTFIKMQGGRVYFTHAGITFSGACSRNGKLKTIASQKIESL